MPERPPEKALPTPESPDGTGVFQLVLPDGFPQPEPQSGFQLDATVPSGGPEQPPHFPCRQPSPRDAPAYPVPPSAEHRPPQPWLLQQQLPLPRAQQPLPHFPHP